MAKYPSDLKYTKDHEWARVEGELVRIGITEFAVEQLGDVTLVDAIGVRRYARPLEPPFARLEEPSEVDNPTAALIAQIAFFFESYRACVATSEGAACDAAVHALERD